MIRWKDSCRFDQLHGAMVLAIMRIEAIHDEVGVVCFITSVNDSAHMENSKHYSGRAIDLRVHHLASDAQRLAVAQKIRAALGPQFTVLFENPSTPNAHIHVQFNGD